MKQLKNSKTIQYSFCNNLYRHLEKSIVTIRQLEKQEKETLIMLDKYLIIMLTCV